MYDVQIGCILCKNEDGGTGSCCDIWLRITGRLKSYICYIPNIKCVKCNIMCEIDNRG